MDSRSFHAGMGQAVAERTILRKKNGNWEKWNDVAHRVALGNSLLCRTPDEQKQEYELLYKHLLKATTLMSGRHLQHGDETQPERNQEIFTNCATSSTSFALFYLLMNGSGVGRCYDDDMMLTNWDNAPTLRCVLNETHPDFDFSAHESVRDARHKYGAGRDVLWHIVSDTREGWAKALEVWENATFEKIHKDKLLILDFSKVRAKGSPIKGMQNRPSSGPVPLMNAFHKALTLKGAGLPRWMQAMYIDHYFAECVLVGGARRAARMSTKTWRDKSVLQFITVKRPIEFADKNIEEIVVTKKVLNPQGFLWSSNNSITVDQEFWTLVGLKRGHAKYKSEMAKHARSVFRLTTKAAYADGTGEPGFINVDKLNQNKENLESLSVGDALIGSSKYTINDDTNFYLNRLLKAASKKDYFMITNPCVTKDTWVMTSYGARQVKDLVGKEFDAIVDGKPYHSEGFWWTGKKKVFEVTTSRGYVLRATDNHKLLVELAYKRKLAGKYPEQNWVRVDELNIGDRLVLCNQRGFDWTNSGEEHDFERGWLVGQIVGDGGHNPEKYDSYLRFWGESQDIMATYAVKCICAIGCKTRSSFTGHSKNNTNKTTTCSCVALSELANCYIEPLTKNIKSVAESASGMFCRGFLRGIFDSDGTVAGRSVRLSQSNLDRLFQVQRMLARLGIISTIYKDRHKADYRKMPDGQGGEKHYWCQSNHELHISKDNLLLFRDLIGFVDPAKSELLNTSCDSIKRCVYKEKFTSKITKIEEIGEEDVYDCSVDKVHCFDANGFKSHNCGEISIAVWGAFCTIADLVPYHADDLDEAEEAFRVVTRALIRVNTMDSIYKKEVTRTNRIGVGITGIHEFAWKFFKLGFKDLLDETVSKEFWLTIARFKKAVQEEAAIYAKKYGMVSPHSDTTIKPSGTVSKLFGLTEGWHLPTMRWYLRWVQFSKNDPLIEIYRSLGYPCRELVKYQNTIIVGFPTVPVITEMNMGKKLVTAAEATPEEQYKWLILGEKYWLRGVSDGKPLEIDTGNQISYTLKYNPTKVDFVSFTQTIKNYQSQVKCCSIMPQEDQSSYEYLPEEPVTKAQYEDIVKQITKFLKEDVDISHVECANGACPIDFKKAS